ncbi:MAG TPA: hypothetical protein V6D21_08000 [Candidatus Obscuribacterales bacterium]
MNNKKTGKNDIPLLLLSKWLMINRSQENVTYLEIGDRTEGDEVEFPNDDLKATQLPNGEWALTHKDGRAY